MKRLSFLTEVLILLTFLFFCCGKGDKGISPELQNKIVYVSEEGICTINPDGTDKKVIVSSDKGAPFSNPQWSPDKKWIGFTGQVSNYPKVMLTKSDGSKLDILGILDKSKDPVEKKKTDHPKVVQKGFSISFVGWSPDGKYILSYPNIGLDRSAFRVMNKKGKTVLQLGGSHPDFCGTDKIVYRATSPGVITMESDIMSYNLKKRTKENLTNDGGVIYYHPVSSPTGDRIAYGFGKATIDNELWIMNSDGSDRRILASQVKDFVGGPLKVIKFSPQGSKILFLPNHDDRSNIYVINEDGTGLQTVVNDIVNAEGGADWSPSGQQIIFTSRKNGSAEIYVINVDGTGLRRLTNNEIKDCCPDW